jgi:hypothetical protein
MRQRGDEWTEAEAAALGELSRIGITKSEAARRLGRHQSTISVRARRAGLRWKPPPKRLPSEKPAPVGPSSRSWTSEDEVSGDAEALEF